MFALDAQRDQTAEADAAMRAKGIFIARVRGCDFHVQVYRQPFDTLKSEADAVKRFDSMMLHGWHKCVPAFTRNPNLLIHGLVYVPYQFK